jgi:hypothetical protein
MSAPESYPCLACDATGQLRAVGKFAARPCPRCVGGRMSRERVAKQIVNAAISVRQFGFGAEPYIALAEACEDEGLLTPWRRAHELLAERGPLVRYVPIDSNGRVSL